MDAGYGCPEGAGGKTFQIGCQAHNAAGKTEYLKEWKFYTRLPVKSMVE
ncbi:MAG: hypothetical protein HFG70_01140 [Hungatella sp.]|jgi:hypothetical protein|nr:hypothetical protein [Hungatella sp.]